MIGRVAFAFVVVLAALAPAQAEERIQRFVSEVDVQRNGDLQVTETISIRAEGRQIRRGILRDFPTTYRRADGSRVEVGFDVQAVTLDGQAERFETERMTNGVRVRIGSADRGVSVGLHQYVIRYRTTRQIGFFKDYDELYWNATGTGWTFPIDVAEARINLPERANFVQNALYTGPQGARGKDAVVVEQSPGRIVFRTTAPLPVANGLTVAAAWPKGIVQEPTRAQQLEAMLKDDPALLTAAVGGGLVIAYYLLAWLFFGRDPRGGTVIPLFAPPKGMSAAAVRFVNEMTYDDRVFAAAIIGLGVNGHLKLIDRGGAKELRHVRDGKPLDAAEAAVSATLFARREKVRLDAAEHELIGGARSSLQSALKRAYSGTLFRSHIVWSTIGLIGAVLATAAICLSYAATYGDNSGGILAGALIPILPVMTGVAMIRAGWRKAAGRGMTYVAIGVAVVLIALAIGVAILGYNIGYGPAMLPALVPSLLGGFAARGFSWLRAPTREGRRVMDEIEGFKQYLGVAEEDRLEFLHPPEKTPELFEKFLPYAIALDVENTWALRFASVLAAAGVGAAVSSWYSGSQSNMSDVTSFSDRLGTSLASTIASASTPPGSSGGSSGSSGGSSGGGSSGGGGGGGGGSGW